MSLNDPLANVLSHIDTYERLGKNTAFTKSTSKVIQKVLRIMQDYGYLGSFEEIIDRKGNFLKINLIGGINKTNVIKPHFKVKNDEMVKFEKRFLPAKDFGLLIMTTSKGIMTHYEAKEKKIGGKLLAYCY